MRKIRLFFALILCISIKSYGLNNLLLQDDTCSVNILQDDTIITSNTTIQIQLNASSGAESYQWTPSTGLNNYTISNPIATVNNTTQYIVEASYLDTNLIYNGNFELGNVGFTTQYNYATIGPTTRELYSINTNASFFESAFCPCVHDGNYIFFDGSINPNTIVYESQVNILPNTDYVFSLELSTINVPPNPLNSLADLQISINNVIVQSHFRPTIPCCTWNSIDVTWNSQNSSIATITIINLNLEPYGNDFGIDNISLRKICKATDTINIIFAPQTIIDTIDITICENELPYHYHDSTFTQSGTYLYNFSTNNIIDSTYLIHLYVLEPYINTINATICEGETYTENGFNQSTQGIYTQELQSINGCDSTIILDLEVKQAYNNTIQATICEGDTYDQNGFYESNVGSYTHTYNSYNGCDSTITLQLQVTNTRDTVIYDTIYSGTAYTNFGFYRTEEGTYFNTYQIGQGCPMNITLYLTVIEIPEVNVWLPNAITPYDVVNTEFGYYTELQYLESIKFEVYNRWGNRIFESTKIGQYWDGTYKGKECQRGLYAWKLKYKTIFEDKLYEKSGNVHLIW